MSKRLTIYCKINLRWLCFYLLFPFSIISNTWADSTFQTYKILNLQTQSTLNGILQNPNQHHQYLLHNKAGEIYLINEQDKQAKLLDLKKFFPNIKQFEGMVTHPDFSLEQQASFLTFYTAHTEPYNSKSKTKRIKIDNDDSPQFETIISEWKFNPNTPQYLSLKESKPREVLRIPVFSASLGIQQLAFNPYTTSWDDEYGQLFFTLKKDPKRAHYPLYSGAILKIDPNKFGLRSYTVSPNNPYSDNESIANEIIAYGINNLTKIHWFRNSANEVLITQRHPKKRVITKVQPGKSISSSLTNPKNKISEETLQTTNSIIYLGNNLSQYKNHLIYLAKDKVWKLIAVSNQPPFKKQVITSIEDNEINQQDELIVSVDQNNEVLLFSNNEKVIYSLDYEASTGNNEYQANDDTANQSNHKWIYWLVLGLLSLFILVKLFYRKKLDIAKKLLRKKYAKFTFNQTKQQIKLFKRHQTEVDTTLNIQEIVKSELLLNNESIFTLTSDDAESCFSAKKDKQLTYLFSQEKRNKMVDDKTRRIDLILTDINNTEYPICAYLRTGNQRLTKVKYSNTYEYIIDWFWLFSETVLPNQTEKRIIKPIVSPPKRTIKKAPQSSILDQGSITESKVDMTETDTFPEKNSSTEEHPEEISPKIKETNTEWIDALEKLGKLKEQGILTEDEFSEAKNKLLKNLND